MQVTTASTMWDEGDFIKKYLPAVMLKKAYIWFLTDYLGNISVPLFYIKVLFE